MLTGEFENNIDDKGRLLIPSRLRTQISGNSLIVTRGFEKCLLVYVPEEWEKISSLIFNSSSGFKAKERILYRKFISPAQECEFDKTGRINIPVSLRKVAGLEKEVLLLAMGKFMEIWDPLEYENYLTDNEDDYTVAAEELGDLLSMKEGRSSS